MSQILINYLASLHRRVRTRPASRWTHRWWKRTCHHSPSDVGPRMERNGTCEVGMRPIAWWCAKKNPVNIAIENHLQIGVLIGTSSVSLSLPLRGWFQLQRLIIGEYIEQNPNVPIVEDKKLVSNYSVHPLGSSSWLTIFVCEFSGSSPTSHGPWSLRWRCQLALHRRCSIPFKPFVLAGCKQFTNLFGN